MVAVAPILISMTLRVLSVSYIDLFGPMYSRQLFKIIGSGTDSLYLILCYSIFLLPFLLFLDFFVFRYRNDLKPQVIPPGQGQSVTLFYFILFGLLGAVYVQLFTGGVIPLFDRMERYDFANNYAGPLHGYLFKYGAILTLFLGGQTVYSKLITKKYDRRSFVIFSLLIAYALLTGHRFAAFNKFGSFFMIPFSLVFAYNFRIKQPTNMKRMGKECWIVLGIGIVSLSVAMFAIVNSYSRVRTAANESVFEKIQERLLIQQGEMWVEAVDRIDSNKKESTETIVDFLFFNPMKPGKNTSIQYLMWASIGEEAVGIIDIGQQYAGGFPEIFLEIFGIYLVLPALILFSVIMVIFFIIFLNALRKGKLLTMLMASFIIYSFVLTIYNGMLNQFFVLTFFIKILLLSMAYLCKPVRIPKLTLFGSPIKTIKQPN